MGLENRKGRLLLFLPKIPLALLARLIDNHCVRLPSLKLLDEGTTATRAPNRQRSGSSIVWLKKLTAFTMLRTMMTRKTHNLHSGGDALRRVMLVSTAH